MTPAPTLTSFTFDVVSPQYPCGAAWLANALLELQVPLQHLWGFDTANEWQQHADQTRIYSAANLPWQQTLAALQVGRKFQFREGVRPRFSHAFPWQLDLCPRIIWMVRDPRDALYSEWQRWRRNQQSDLSFLAFCQASFFGGPINMVDMLWLHLKAWLTVYQSRPANVYLLRMEDWKRAPAEALTSVTEWMGLSCDAQSLIHAAAASDVQHLQTIEQSLIAQVPSTRQFNRAGIAEEWRKTWQPEWSQALGVHWRPIFQTLGYEIPITTEKCATNFDWHTVLSWRDLHDAELAAHWQRQILV